MKQSLSGVWKAYVMQTMNGQSGKQERLDDGDDIDEDNDDNDNDNDNDNNDDDGRCNMMMAMVMNLTMSCGDEAEHDSFVECKSLSLLHLYPLLVQTLESFMKIA